MTSKILNANRTLGMFKQSLLTAPGKAKLLAYTSLCRPLLDYADTLYGTRIKINHTKT